MEKLSEARRLLKETGVAITKQNHVLYEFEEWDAIDKAVAQLEAIISGMVEYFEADYNQPPFYDAAVKVFEESEDLTIPAK